MQDDDRSREELLTDLVDLRRTHEGYVTKQRALEVFEAIINNSTDVITVLDAQGVVTYASPSLRQFGYRQEDIEGTSAFARVHPDELEPARLLFEGLCAERGGVRRVDLRWKTADGEFIPVEIIAQNLLEDPCIRGIVLNYRDLRERNALESQVRHAQRLETVGTLAAGLAHDFNNILSAVHGSAVAGLAASDIPPEAARRFTDIVSSAQRAGELVRRLLAFGRTDDRSPEPVSLASVVNEAVALVRPGLAPGVTLGVQISEQGPLVLGDATQFLQVVINLLANAEQALRESGGSIAVAVDCIELSPADAARIPGLHPAAYVRVVVEDDGPGMSAEVRERVFEPYFTTKSPGEGTGLGLAVVHGIVTGAGGTITVDSTPGQGTAFQALFPSAGSTTEPVRDEVPRASGHERVLIVDDEPVILQLTRDVLSRLGYTVLTAGGGHDAFEILEKNPHGVDVLITDQSMPDMPGSTLVRAARALRPDLPVILCTGFSLGLDEDTTRAMAVDAFILKPISPRELAVTLQRVLASRRA